MQNLSAVFVDAGGATSIFLYHLTDAAILTDVFVATAVSSNADWQTYWGNTAFSNPGPVPSAATYQTLRPSAQLFYMCADGTIADVQIPSPISALFLADGQTVDPLDPTGAIAALQAIVTSATGSLPLAFIGGHLGTKA